MKIKKHLKNNNGSSILGFIVIVVVTVIIAMGIIPSFNIAAKNRSGKIINVFNSTDTIIVD